MTKISKRYFIAMKITLQ